MQNSKIFSSNFDNEVFDLEDIKEKFSKEDLLKLGKFINGNRVGREKLISYLLGDLHEDDVELRTNCKCPRCNGRLIYCGDYETFEQVSSKNTREVTKKLYECSNKCDIVIYINDFSDNLEIHSINLF